MTPCPKICCKKCHPTVDAVRTFYKIWHEGGHLRKTSDVHSCIDPLLATLIPPLLSKTSLFQENVLFCASEIMGRPSCKPWKDVNWETVALPGLLFICQMLSWIKRFLCQEDRARLEADCLMILLLDCHDSLNEVLVLRCAQIPLDMIDICPISVFE